MRGRGHRLAPWTFSTTRRDACTTGCPRPRSSAQDTALVGWGEVFGIIVNDPGGRREVLARGVDLMYQAELARQQALVLPESLYPDLLLEHFDQVESALDRFSNLDSHTMGGSSSADGEHRLERPEEVSPPTCMATLPSQPSRKAGGPSCSIGFETS